MRRADPDWELLDRGVRELAVLVDMLADAGRCDPHVVLDALHELLDGAPEPVIRPHLVPHPPVRREAS